MTVSHSPATHGRSAQPGTPVTAPAGPASGRSRAVRLLVAALVLTLLPVLPVSARPPSARPVAASVAADWRAPVDGAVAQAAELPAAPWLAGHRGVDLVAGVGAPVVAPADGTVSFAGPVAGRAIVVVTHGALRSTLEPVVGTLPVGTRVRAGQTVGTVTAEGSHCAPASCLHWGVRRGDTYLDPLTLLGRAAPIVLLPAG